MTIKTQIMTTAFLICITVASFAVDSEQNSDGPLIVSNDTGKVGGSVELEALPGKGGRNSVKKTFDIQPGSLTNVVSAEIQLLATLRDPSGNNNFASDVWDWIFFELNGYGWVLRAENIPLPRHGLSQVDWKDVDWGSISIPNIRYLREGTNELVVWNNNAPKKPKDKYLVMAYDDSGQSSDSFALNQDKWDTNDLNSEREGTPAGEWLIRLKLNNYTAEERNYRDSVGAARLRQAVEDKKEFIWGITDSVHKIFPDQPYPGPFENKWQLDAAQNEYESCQLVLAPTAGDMRMASVAAGAFTGANGATIPASATKVRIVRTARINNREWPGPLPETYPIDIRRGETQSYWVTVHVPADARPGIYTSNLTITSMSSGGEPTKVPLALRVRDFDLPTLSRFQMVGPTDPERRPYHIVACSPSGPSPRPYIYLDAQDNIKVEFDEFDRRMEQALAEGVTNFSMGFAYTGAGAFIHWPFYWKVPVEGQDKPRRISLRPVDPTNPDADTPEILKARKYFTQYLSQFYSHLVEKGWIEYFYVYGADEPHEAKLTEPLTRYFAIIKEVAPKLRIMITKGPTEEYGPNVDIVCIMTNNLRAESIQSARNNNQELWAYSCGHLANPSLIVAESNIRLRLWYWLQEKWNVERVLLWHTSAGSRNFLHAGVDRRGDGQIFWNDNQQVFPSIRAELLRDGIEDREYIYKLKQLTDKLDKKKDDDSNAVLLAKAKQLAEVPDDIIETQFKMTHDIDKLLSRRAEIADMIEKLQTVLAKSL